MPEPWVPWWASLVAPLAKNSCQLQQWTMEIDGKWWEMMGIDGKWWEMMGKDGKWWEDHPLHWIETWKKPENNMETNLKWRHMASWTRPSSIFIDLLGDTEPGWARVIRGDPWLSTSSQHQNHHMLEATMGHRKKPINCPLWKYGRRSYFTVSTRVWSYKINWPMACVNLGYGL